MAHSIHPTTLGGGMHGHLGLIVSENTYGTLTNNVLSVTPQDPGPLPPAGATSTQIEAAKDVWKDLSSTFQICQANEQALIAQIVEIADPVYLRAMLNTTTAHYAANICVLLDHLFTNYGKITPQQIMAKEIKDLGKLAEHAGQPMSPINLTYIIFAK